jgi:hypothetical protein
MRTYRGSREEVVYSLVRWAIFAVALALLPILIGILGSVTRGDKVGIVDLLENGELFLVSAAIVGAALADLVTEGGQRFRTLKLTTGGAAGLVGITAAAWFADVAAGRRDGLSLDSTGIAVGSLIVFGSALIAGASCIVVAELAKKQ